MLAYTSRRSSNALSVAEISFLLKMPRAVVHRRLREALRSLRGAVLGVALGRQELEQQFDVVLQTGVCAVCGSRTPNPLPDNLHHPDLPIAYCSAPCMDCKPPALLVLEVNYGVEWKQLIRWALRRFGTVPAMTQALGVPRKTVLWMMDRLGDVDAVVDETESNLRKRSVFSAVQVDAWMKRLQPQRERLHEQVGQPKLDMHPLFLAVQEMLTSP
jgi:hypothetical protein